MFGVKGVLDQFEQLVDSAPLPKEPPVTTDPFCVHRPNHLTESSELVAELRHRLAETSAGLAVTAVALAAFGHTGPLPVSVGLLAAGDPFDIDPYE